MHVAKYTRGAAAAMMHHYMRDRRGTLDRDNIDRERTPLNYVIGAAPRIEGDDGVPDASEALRYDVYTGEPVMAEAVRMTDDGARCIGGTEHVRSRGYDAIEDAIERIESQDGARRVRKDAIVMADLVVTRPDNVPPEDEREFFALAYEWLTESVGRGNVLGCWVHMDETTPHAHMAYMPITRSAKGLETFSFKRLCPRSWYKSLHTDMQEYIGERLGYEPHLLLSDDERESRIYTERTEDIDRIREVAAQAVVDEVGKLVDTQNQRKNEQEKLDRATERVKRKEARSAEISAEISAKEEESAAAKKEAEKAREDAQTARASLSQVQAELSQATAERDAARGDRDAARDELARAQAERDEAREAMATAVADQVMAQRERDEARAELADVRQQVADARAELDEAREEARGMGADAGLARADAWARADMATALSEWRYVRYLPVVAAAVDERDAAAVDALCDRPPQTLDGDADMSGARAAAIIEAWEPLRIVQQLVREMVEMVRRALGLSREDVGTPDQERVRVAQRMWGAVQSRPPLGYGAASHGGRGRGGR